MKICILKDAVHCTLLLGISALLSCQKSTIDKPLITSPTVSDAQAAPPVTRPMKVDFKAISDFSVPPVECLPEGFGSLLVAGAGKISGSMTYLGNVSPDKSPFTVTGCYPGPGENQVTQVISGIITAANGDQLNFTGEATVTFTDASLKGSISITNGSGRFTGATGLVAITGTLDFTTGTADWSGSGTITY